MPAGSCLSSTDLHGWEIANTAHGLESSQSRATTKQSLKQQKTSSSFISICLDSRAYSRYLERCDGCRKRSQQKICAQERKRSAIRTDLERARHVERPRART